jgi:P27 family predicted phage terminase small subunit
LALVREGNPGHRTKDRFERGVKLPPGAPPAPKWIDLFPTPAEKGTSLTAANVRCRKVAAEEWTLIVPQLDAMGLLAKVDRQALIEWCVCVARVDQAERQISNEGLTMQGERGWQRNGAAILAKGYRDTMAKLRGELGLSPLARDALRGDTGGVGDGEEEDSPYDV